MIVATKDKNHKPNWRAKKIPGAGCFFVGFACRVDQSIGRFGVDGNELTVFAVLERDDNAAGVFRCLEFSVLLLGSLFFPFFFLVV